MAAVASLAVACAGVGTSAVGCAGLTLENPDFPLTLEEADASIRTMSMNPVALSRPVVIIAGYRDMPRVGAKNVAEVLVPATSGWPGDFLAVDFPLANTMRDYVEHTIFKVEAAFPSDDPEWTSEVDVVGISLGGLVARVAALPSGYLDVSSRRAGVTGEGGGGSPAWRKRLRIRRMFALGVPFDGSPLAGATRHEPVLRDMTPGSAFMERLRASDDMGGYEVIPYVKLLDISVGSRSSAPDGERVIWTSGTVGANHLNIVSDRRILADIAMKLRGGPGLGRPSLLPY